MERYSINRVLGSDINISVPLGKTNTVIGMGESIDNLVTTQTGGRITPFVDEERVAYRSNQTDGITINFRFFNKETNSFDVNYGAAGFNLNELNKSSFTKSFFRLYFYNTNDLINRNLMLFEELNVIDTTTPILNLNKIFWLRNDIDFKNNNNNKTFYVIGRFFNALTGKVHEFINLPTNINTPIDITQFSQNQSWWSTPIMILNPNNNSGNYNFITLPFVGANTVNTITLTEQIIL
jgi:hypothetical protein